MLSFLRCIWQNGRVLLSHAELPSPTSAPDDASTDAAASRELLQEMDGYRRLDLPGDAPPLHLPAAEWAASQLYTASQFLVFREIDPEVVAERMARPCPAAPSPSVCYSVDLTFSALPDLISLARGIAVDNPLTAGLMALATQWPLSSVGVGDVTAVKIDGFIHEDCLARLYVDRIIRHRDVGRLDHPTVRKLAAEAIGPYEALAPLIASELKEKHHAPA